MVFRLQINYNLYKGIPYIFIAIISKKYAYIIFYDIKELTYKKYM